MSTLVSDLGLRLAVILHPSQPVSAYHITLSSATTLPSGPSVTIPGITTGPAGCLAYNLLAVWEDKTFCYPGNTWERLYERNLSVNNQAQTTMYCIMLFLAFSRFLDSQFKTCSLAYVGEGLLKMF